MKLRSAKCEVRSEKGSKRFSQCLRAFTLLELMVVVAIIGMIMAVGAPTLYKVLKKEGFRKAVGDMMDACSAARSRAILSQQTTELVFHPREKTCEVTGGASGGWGGWATKVNFGDDVTIEGLGVNWMDYTDSDVARVRFFPDGKCDEMELVLYDNKTGERRGITLELTTGLATLDTDLKKMMLR